MQATPPPQNSPVSNPSLRTQKIANRGVKASKYAVQTVLTTADTLKQIFVDYEKNSHCLIFAVNKYPNAKKLDDLKCAVADGLLVAETLCGCTPVFEDSSGIWESPKEGNEKKGQNFSVKMFIDHAVTKDAIEHALAELMKQYSYDAPQVGRLYICMAGHGLLDDISGSSVFCCSDYTAEDSYTTSYPLDELRKKLQRIGLRHQIVHLDCCHAGGIFTDNRDEKIDYDLINMANRPSVSAITAVTKDEQSLETNGHGIFSKHLCDQVKDEYIFQRHNRDYVTMTELFGAVRKQVSNMARNDFKQDMTPVHGKVLLQHLKEQCCGEMLFFKPGLNTANLGIASWGGGGGGGGGWCRSSQG